MAKFEALYHPDMEPPQSWLRAWARFFDTIYSLVPSDSQKRLSPALEEFASVNPGVYRPLEPPPGTNTVPDIDLRRFDRALGIIAATRDEPQSVEIEIGPEASVRVKNHVSMHKVKLSREIEELLTRHELLLPELAEGLGMTSYRAVHEDACDLILSYICRRIAKSEGWSSLTDCEVPFSVVASEDLQPPTRNDAVDALTAIVISMEVPEDIQHVDPKAYREIRNAYADLREPFQALMLQFAQLHRLEGMGPQQFRERVRSIASEFDTRATAFRADRMARRIRKWSPIGIGGLATITGAALAGPAVAIPGACISVAVSILQRRKASFRPSVFGEERCLDMIADLRQDLLKAPRVSELAGQG